MNRKRRAPSLTFSETYHAVQSFLVHIGATPTELDEPADGIVAFSGGGFWSRLRYDDAAVTQGAILALLNSIDDDSATPALFSATGFTGSAEVFGENLNVALFNVAPTGDMVPRSPAAHNLMPVEPFEPPFGTTSNEEDLDRPPGVWMPGQSGIADHEWIDCQVCGTTHHPEANFCHRCGASLVRRNRVVPTAKTRASFQSSTTPPPLEVQRRAATLSRERLHEHTDAMRCRNCGSDDIEILDERPGR